MVIRVPNRRTGVPVRSRSVNQRHHGELRGRYAGDKAPPVISTVPSRPRRTFGSRQAAPTLAQRSATTVTGPPPSAVARGPRGSSDMGPSLRSRVRGPAGHRLGH